MSVDCWSKLILNLGFSRVRNYDGMKFVPFKIPYMSDSHDC